MGDAGVGLVLGFGVDNTEALRAFEELTESAQRSAVRSAAAFGGVEEKVTSSAEAARLFAGQVTPAVDKVERSLLNQHQTVHLLAEEMGVHLPRAVIGGISEILPAIGGLGGALLGVFAVEEIYRWGKAGVEAIREMEGETSSLKQAMDEIVKEQEQILRKPKTIDEANNDLAETERRLSEVAKRTQELQKDLLTAPEWTVRAVEIAATAGVAKSRQSIEEIKRELNDLQAEENKLNARHKEQLDTTTQLQKDAQRERQEAEKEALEWSERYAREAEAKRKLRAEEAVRFDHERLEERIRGEREWDRIVKEDAETEKKAFEEVQKSMRYFPVLPTNYFAPLIEGTKQLTAAERLALPTETEIARVRAELMKINPDLTREEAQATAQRLAANPAIQQEIRGLTILKHAHADLEAEIRRELQLYPQYLGFMDSFTEAAHRQADAVGKDMSGAVKNIAEGVASLIAGRRAQAAIECIFEGAAGAQQLAMAFDPEDPNHVQHALSAAEHFVAAVEYGRVAATSPHHHNAGGGAGGGGGGGRFGGGGGSYGGGGGRDWSTPPQTLAPGAAGGGRYGSPGTGVVVVHGSSDFHAFIAAAVTEAANRGYSVTSTTSMRGSPVGH